MARDHYKLLYRLDGVERLLLWFTDERDGVVSIDDQLRGLQNVNALQSTRVPLSTGQRLIG